MENKQKRKLINAVYKTIILFSVLSLGIVIYLAIDKISSNTSILWLDITLLCVTFLIFVYIISDVKTTIKLKNKNTLGKYLFFIVFNTIISIVVLAIYCYYNSTNLSDYISYIVPISLIFGTELISIINFLLGINLTKLYKNTMITLDSTSQTPNFNDELLLKKRLDELNRKLAVKEIQSKIDEVEKKLDE